MCDLFAVKVRDDVLRVHQLVARAAIVCATCCDGTVVCNICDECGEWHCPHCDSCDDDDADEQAGAKGALCHVK